MSFSDLFEIHYTNDSDELKNIIDTINIQEFLQINNDIRKQFLIIVSSNITYVNKCNNLNLE